MTNTIAQLWNGDLDPSRRFGRNNPEIRRLELVMYGKIEDIETDLDEHHQSLFRKYQEYLDEYIFAISEQAFSDGFCLGTALTAEGLTGANQIL